MECFDNIAVVPFTDLLDQSRGGYVYRGGPIWPNWTDTSEARHWRAQTTVDVMPELGAGDRLEELPATAWWGGPVCEHFGHQIAEFSTRILASSVLAPDIPLCFSSHPRSGIRSALDFPSFFKDVLTWYGVSLQKCIHIGSPTRVGQLRCMPQAEILSGSGPSPAYLDLLDDLFARNRARFSSLDWSSERAVTYVSRAAMTARIAGESYLESLLAGCGVEVLRPESENVMSQLARYSTSRVLIFSEGSAMHGAQLLGRKLGDVVVLNRRQNSNLAAEQLGPRSRSMHYIDLGGLIHGLNTTGRKAPHLGICVPDAAKLLETFKTFGIEVGGSSNEKQFRAAIERDLRSWIEREHHSARAAVKGSMEMIQEKLVQEGFGNLCAILS